MKGSPMLRNYGIGAKTVPLNQTDSDLKDYLMDEKGFSQADADKQIEDGSYTTSDKDFLAWYKKQKGEGKGEKTGGEASSEGGEQDAMAAMAAAMGGGAPMMYKKKSKTSFEQKSFDIDNINQNDYDKFAKGKEGYPDIRYLGDPENKKYLDAYLKYKKSKTTKGIKEEVEEKIK